MGTGITIQIKLPDGIEKFLPKIEEFLENFDGKNIPAPLREEIMTADDVCDEFKIPKTKLYGLTMQKGPGTIPRFKIGRDLRFKRSELIPWFELQKVE